MEANANLITQAPSLLTERDRLREVNAEMVKACNIVMSKLKSEGAQRIIAGDIGEIGAYLSGAECRQIQEAIKLAEGGE